MVKIHWKQESIPVGCIPPAAVAITGGLHTHPRAGTPPEQAPPWSRHPPEQAPPPSQIPLNFPLGCGPGPDPPQFPPWLWAWTRSPSTSPWLWAWTPPSQIPLNFPLGCGPENPQGMLGYHPPRPETCYKACWDTTCNACWDSTPPVDRHTPVKT